MYKKNMDKEKLEQMLNTSSKVVGSKQVLKGISDSTVRCVIVASDADAQIKKRIVAQAKANGVEIVYVASKKRLGESAGVEVSAAAVGIVEAKA
ncbi:MAG TPA: 50S ribosomal protein L7ae-like protein [Clostridiales bacterium]|nr:50S ribosomal protein L7ae-like protein [Clostridiales bacterium]